MTVTTNPCDTTTPDVVEHLLNHDVDDDLRAWARQRLFHLGDTEGWFRYLAGDRAGHRYALRLPDGTVRVLHRDFSITTRGTQHRRDEPLWWLLGHTYAHPQRTTAILDAIGEPPELYDTDRVGRLLELSTVTINNHVQIRKLNPLYIARRRRRYFADEIRALIGDDDDVAVWNAIRAGLPPTTGLEQIVYTETPAPDPLPLPLPDRGDLTGHCQAALRIADEQGWLAFTGYDRDRFTITLDGGAGLQISRWAVLPFVWGVADAHQGGDLVAYPR